MAGRRSYKSDDSFLRFISMGAIGTQRVFDHLQEQGHYPIELERGSMNFKIWKNIKIKRIRVPDLLCINCGHRIESRAKTKLEITMSHSQADQTRGWDYGLENDDYVALVVCHDLGQSPVNWKADELVQYIQIQDMRVAYQNNLLHVENPKGAGQGFETRVTWPASVASADGVIKQITNGRLQFSRASDLRTISLKLEKKGIELQPLVSEGEEIKQNQILASVVPVTQYIACSPHVDAQDYIRQLTSPSLSEKYAAAKVLSYFHSTEITDALVDILPSKNHIYVRLEAAASLARQDDQRGIDFIKHCLENSYYDNQLEAIIILGEVRTHAAANLLINTLGDDTKHPEIRAGAAWALGEMQTPAALGALIQSFLSVEDAIRIEAARALAKLTDILTNEIVTEFSASDAALRPGIAWALSKAKTLTVDDLLATLTDDDARRWVAYILGMQGEQKHISRIEYLKQEDPEVYFAVTVLWQILSSWVYDLEEYG